MPGKTEFEATRTASQDGKMLTASRTDYPVDGSQPVKVEVKRTRVSTGPAGSNATSGSFRVNRAVHAPSAKKCAICCVYDHIYDLPGDVAFQNQNPSGEEAV